MKANTRLVDRLHAVVRDWLNDLAQEVAALAPAPAKSRVSPRKVKRRTKASWAKQAPQRDPLVSVPAPTIESAKPDPPVPTLHLSPPRVAVEKSEAITPEAPTVTVSSPAKRWGLPPASAPKQPKPAGAPALMGAPRAPLVGAGRGRSAEQLRQVSQRGAAEAKASKATTRALGPNPKRSLSDDELEAWASEQLERGISGTVPLSALEGSEEPAAAPVPSSDEEEET